MVFKQGRGFVIGASFGLPIRSLRCRVLIRRGRGHRLFGNAISFW